MSSSLLSATVNTISKKLVLCVLANTIGEKYSKKAQSLLAELEKIGTLVSSDQSSLGHHLGVDKSSKNYKLEVFVFEPNPNAFLDGRYLEDHTLFLLEEEVVTWCPRINTALVEEFKRIGLTVDYE